MRFIPLVVYFTRFHCCIVFHCGYKERKKVKLLGRVWLFVNPWTIVHQAPPSMEFSRQEYWSWLPFPSPGDLPNARIEPGISHIVGRCFTVWATRESHCGYNPQFIIVCIYSVVPWGGKITWKTEWQPLQYSCLENSMDRRSWWTLVHGVTKSWTRLSD